MYIYILSFFSFCFSHGVHDSAGTPAPDVQHIAKKQNKTKERERETNHTHTHTHTHTHFTY